MSIRNEFEKIDPTEKQKKDIFRRIEESSKLKTDFRHQVIRYTSVAAAAVVVVGAVTVGVHFVTKGNGIDYTVSTVSGSSSGAVSAADASASKADNSKDNVQDGENKSDNNTSHTDYSSANDSNTIYPDINTLKAQVRNDKEFWAEIGKQYGPYHYEGSTVRFDFINGFDDFKLCTDEAIGNEIIDKVKRQWLFDNIVDFGSGYHAIKGAKDLSTSEDIEKFTRENLINGEYFEADPEFFGFSDMKGFYDAASELYTGFDYDNFKSFIPYYYAEVDGKLCISKNHGLGEKGKPPHSVELGQYLLIYDNVDPSVIYCFVAVPEMNDSASYSFSLDFYVFINTENGLRCSVTKERPITTCGLVTDEPEITTDDNGNCLINKAFHDKIMNDELTDDEFTKLISYVYTGDVSINEQPNSLVKARTEYNKTIQRTFNRYILSGRYENDDEWHITPATPGNCHSMKEWYDTACTLYADMPDYDTFLSRYSEYFKFDGQGNFYYATGRPDEQLIGSKMPFNAPSYSIFDVSPRCFTVNESTSGGTGLSIGVLYFYSVGTDDTTYGVNVAYFDVKETSEGYRFITNEG